MHRNLRCAGALFALLMASVLVGCGGVYMNGPIGSDAGPQGAQEDDGGKLGLGSFSTEGGDSDPTPEGGGALPMTDSGSAFEASVPEAGGGSPDAGGSVEAASPEAGAAEDSSTPAAACPMTTAYALEAAQAIAGGAPVVCNSQTLVCPGGSCCYVQQSPFPVCVTQ